MQTDLRELQPKLIETSKDTVQLIGVIEKETIEVEKVKAVVEADKAVADEAAAEAKAIKVIINIENSYISLNIYIFEICK